MHVEAITIILILTIIIVIIILIMIMIILTMIIVIILTIPCSGRIASLQADCELTVTSCMSSETQNKYGCTDLTTQNTTTTCVPSFFCPRSRNT